ncbi:proline dehydrogenase family protein [Nocardioides bruguierae]|uniref:proline dehydrogenase n=1 Tax=Nocardioides bruguierae TaxID=2945102 RepID=A0A9X2DAB1_9ACTN|nr:proline dehydrogenase family protein [Nocardioides bruguierae]MCL8023846.1 proline dehydrogenase family protein [Nocardioides bruguierae]MCM0621707.1 proline dehydrogenase family protein [Nocardioides bruguierae]
MPLLRAPLLMLARNERARVALTSMPATAQLVSRYVPGPWLEDALDAARALEADGLTVSLDHLGEDVTDPADAEEVVEAYRQLLAGLVERRLTPGAEVSLKLSALGQGLPDGQRTSLEHARTICRAARNAGTAVTLDMEDHTTTDATLQTLRELRKDFPETGVAVQAQLHRTEGDVRLLTGEGSRVRLCKGAYAAPASVAFTDPLDVSRSFVRCLKVLMAGAGYPMIATHDPRLLGVALALAARHGREPGSYELQMLYGIRETEQRRLVAAGETVRVYLPYGARWWGYLVRRLAERPASLRLLLTSLVRRT